MDDIKQELKGVFTAYWHFLTLNAACELQVFDAIAQGNNHLNMLVDALCIDRAATEKLMLALLELGMIEVEEERMMLTKKGQLLTENHPQSLKNACLLWAKEHLTAWQNLAYSIQTGKPAFEYLHQKPFFSYLQAQPSSLKNYHLAMSEYAKDDYQNLPQIIDFSCHTSLMDVGGGLGVLADIVAKACPTTTCTVFDLPEVIALIPHPEKQAFHVQMGSFFEPLPTRVAAIVLSRVLHDWKDTQAIEILNNCHNSLTVDGSIYVIEIVQNEIHAHLLSLNMLLMCESYERSFAEYQQLLAQANFQVIDRKPLNHLQTILIAKKI